MTDIDPDGGFCPRRLAWLEACLRSDVARGRGYGIVAFVCRAGMSPWCTAVGARSAATATELSRKDVFSIFSMSKAFTNALLFRCIDRGDVALTTAVADVIPQFAGNGREKITIAHLLTHRSGLPPVLTPRTGMCIDRLDEVIEAICAHVQPLCPPDTAVWYSPMVSHALLGDIVRRCDDQRRSFHRIAQEELFAPLGMQSTSFGVRGDLRERHVVPTFPSSGPPMEHPGRSGLGRNGAFEEEEAEMPWVGAISTVDDLYHFTEMLRRQGEYSGGRMISPALLALARHNRTGDQPHEIYRAMCRERGWPLWPASLGLGFQLRGATLCRHHFGTLASPETYGHTGLGSSLFWTDPRVGVTFICLTAGVMSEMESIQRFQRLSDLVHSATL